MLKRTVSGIVIMCILVSLFVMDTAAAGVSVSAQSVVVMNAVTREIVYEKNAHTRRGIASTTKIMTSLLALESGKLNKTVVVNGEDSAVEGTSIGLKAGDKVSLGVLVAGMLLESGNDAANTTARALSGGNKAFARIMNKRARELGMVDTCFKNPSGLTEEGHYSTAYDMALLTACAIRNKEFRDICSRGSMTVSYGTPEYSRTFYNHNRLLKSCEGVFGVKTGFTKAAGRCLVSAAERDGVTLIVVTLSAPDDWNDHKKLYDYCFSKIKKQEIEPNEIDINVVGSDNKFIKANPEEKLCFPYFTDNKYELYVYCPAFIYAPVKKGDLVGYVRVVNKEGYVLCECPLVAGENAQISIFEQETEKTIKDKLLELLSFFRR